jgi:hypothetical protein
MKNFGQPVNRDRPKTQASASLYATLRTDTPLPKDLCFDLSTEKLK